MPKNQPLKNKEYWMERQEALSEQLLNKGEEFYEKLAAEYQTASNSIEDEINKFYSRFAQNNEISFADAKQKLTTAERKKFQLTLDQYIKKGRTLNYSDKWIKTLENASLLYRISRLQSIQLQMRQIIEDLNVTFVQGTMDLMGSVYTDSYYLHLFELAKGTNAAVRFDRVDEGFVEKLIARPWTADNVNLTDRIRVNKDKLIDYLDTRFTQGLIRGDGKAAIIKDMSNQMNVSRNSAGRFVMTETAFYSSAATNDAYKTHGVEEFEFLATLDKKTSEVCRTMDGVISKRSDYRVGVNAPPLHVYCRSTTIPVVDDIWDDEPERAARSSDGKYYRVPANINYDTWFNEYAI